MERKCFNVGLFERTKLICEDDDRFEFFSMMNDKPIVVKGKKSDNSMKVENENECLCIDDSEIEKQVIKQILEDGSRWEGDWYNEQPFGFGSIYDGEGNRIYSGFMFEGKKIGFGEEFFADNHKIDYCGNFMNDKRHGWGITYDRNGQKLFEGDWRCGKNDFEERIVIEDNCEEDDLRIHDLIKELEIGEKCFKEWKDDLVIENYPNLEKILVKEKSLQNLNSLKICNCEKLETIEIKTGDERIINGQWYDNGALRNVNNVIIESI